VPETDADADADDYPGQRLGLPEAPARTAGRTGIAGPGGGQASEHAQDEGRSVTVL